MIKYGRCGLDEIVIRLLKKLEPDFPAQSVIVDIENNFVSIVKVFYDNKVYGILVIRGEVTHKKELKLVIDHAIAEENLATSFSSILTESLFDFAKDQKFDIIEQRAHKAGLARMLKNSYGEPKEWIFKKELKSWEKGQAQAIHHSQHQASTTVSEPTTEQ